MISGRKVEWESEVSNRKEALSFSCADPIRPIMIEIIVLNTPLFMLGMISDANSKETSIRVYEKRKRVDEMRKKSIGIEGFVVI